LARESPAIAPEAPPPARNRRGSWPIVYLGGGPHGGSEYAARGDLAVGGQLQGDGGGVEHGFLFPAIRPR
jgi:hypothetical protein